MAKLISPDAIVGKNVKLEHPVRIFAYAGIQTGAKIGRFTYINRYSFVHGSVTMGRYCSVARSVDVGAKSHRMDLMSTHPFQYSKAHFDTDEGYQSFERDYADKSDKTNIGHDVWFGAKSIISTGVTIGTGAIVGANSFVRADVPPYAIMVGTPARILRFRFPDDVIPQLLESRWWDLLPEQMAGIKFDNIELALKQIADRKYQIAVEEERKKEEALQRKAEKARAAKLAAEKKRQKDEALMRLERMDDDPFIQGLRQSLRDMMVPDEVEELALENVAAVAETFDPLDPSDQEILRNKLAYLGELLAQRGAGDLTVNEKRHIASLFRQKQ